MPTTESKHLWRAARLSIALTTLGGAITFIVSQIFDALPPESEQYLNVNLVRSSMAILSIFSAVFVVSIVKRSETTGQCEVTFQDLYAWIVTTGVLSSSVVFIEGLGRMEIFALGCFVALHIVVTTLYYASLVTLVSADHNRVTIVGLLLPSFIGLFSISNPTSSPTVEVLSQIVINGISLLLLIGFTRRHRLRMTVRQSTEPRLVSVSVAAITVALLLGSVSIPLHMPLNEKIRYLNIVESTRLPLFAVVTFLVLSSKWQIQLSSEPVRNLVTRRRLGMLGSIVGATSFAIFLCGLPFGRNHLDFLFLSVSVGLVSTVMAILLPWISIRIRDLRIDFFDVIILVLAGCASFWFRNSTSLWQQISLLSLATVLITFSIRHFRRTEPVLRSIQVEHPRKSVQERDGLTTVVIPSFNSGSEIMNTLMRVRHAFQTAQLPCEIIVVSDGSTDESVSLLENSTDLDLHIWLRTNHGKGGALREGFARSNGDVICFIDADGDLDPIALPGMAQLIWENKFDIVYGSKAHPDSNVSMSSLRKLVSFTFRTLVRILFRFDVADTQTGIKAFNGQFIRSSLQLTSEEGFNLDLELFVVAQTLGYNRFGETAIVLNRRGGSSVHLGTLLAMFFSTLRMYQRFNLTLDYVRGSENSSSRD